MAKHYTRRLDDPVMPRPLKGDIFTEVMEVCKEFDPKPISLVEVSIDGPTDRDDQKTNPQGTTEFTGLTPGGYTVSIKIPDDKAAAYDFAEDTSSREDVPANKKTVFYFEAPTHWVKVQVLYKDAGGNRDVAAPGVKYNLKHLKLPNWRPPSGTVVSGRAEVFEKPVPRGGYRLEVKTVSDCAWVRRGAKRNEAPRVVVGEALDLRAKTTGFNPGAAGRFEVVDACDLDGQALCVVQQAVAGQGDAQELKASWTPSEAQFAKLKSGAVVFRAVVDDLCAFSPPARVFKKVKFQLEDTDGAQVNTAVRMIFTGGRAAEGKSAGGVLEVERNSWRWFAAWSSPTWRGSASPWRRPPLST